jgi:phosphoadenosine phosphosulfate reductase
LIVFLIRETTADTDVVPPDQTAAVPSGAVRTHACQTDVGAATRSDRLEKAFGPLDPIQRIRLLRQELSGRLVFTTSFGLEDQALTHLVTAADVGVELVTLDTGRMFPETYEVWAATEARYAIRIRAVQPDAQAVEDLVSAQGINGFYTSKTAREACCAVRKQAPLARALEGAAGWITGLRADQSALRRNMRFVSEEASPPLLKANPLFDWTRDQVAALVQANDIPSNPLHQRGFLSIGCAPCTRAVAPGEPERAGRWWWEDEGTAECGLHLSADGRLVRAQPVTTSS